ncbi:TPA: YfdQ family protein [Mannheimia haemolytica]|uniref:DUF2303 family protein n=1 Tax=Mannheimia haemolytica TaxID=75985 RepID=UPI00077E8FED|nr:DUF2303 family protein [Mannheimia haemolytica]KYL11775.1 hypothetical protein AC568_01640 [Mannheimia haemolytica]UFK43862.1 YfdQ family protein [Mannheimia haemolytica]UQX78855.1 YfdQ family protein [Mannheimia haemolytica]HDL1148363.1 YfdQ family protein [Mannheimia haemolytica]HDL1198398.1 YfdQ family protein [Mannheimia haemolytica]
MDKSTIQQISTLAVAATKEVQTDFGTVMLPEGIKLQNLEPFQAHRNQFRAAFSTQRFGSLIEYATANAQENAQCFIDQEKMSAEIVFDMGNREQAGHAKHRAKLAMKKTAAYKALCEINGSRRSQRDFSDFLEDWGDYLTAYHHEDEISIKNAVQAVRKMTIDYARNEEHELSDFAAKKSAMESVEAKSTLQLPTHLVFTCNPYNGLDTRSFTLRVQVLTGSGEPVLTARLVQAEQIEEAIATEFAEKLSDALSETSIKVNIGTIEI